MKVDLNKLLKNLKSLPILIIPFGVIVACGLVILLQANNDNFIDLVNEDDNVIQKFGNEIEISFFDKENKQIKVRAEVAQTREAIEKGLMNRTFLPYDHAMIFVFSSEAPRVFWMKDTYIPLDIVFISKEKEIVKIYKNATPLDETPDKYKSEAPAMYAIELNGGWIDYFGVEPGSKVSF